MIVGQDNYSGAEPNTLGIKAVDDHFHMRNWPSNPTAAPVPVYTALWKAPAAAFSARLRRRSERHHRLPVADAERLPVHRPGIRRLQPVLTDRSVRPVDAGSERSG